MYTAILGAVMFVCLWLWSHQAAIKAAVIKRLRNPPSSNNSEVHRFSDPDICLKILKGTTYSKDDALGINKLPFATSRAIPNQRIVRAFGIDNGFTTSDNGSREGFRNWAITKLSTFDEKRWKDTASRADQFGRETEINHQWIASKLEVSEGAVGHSKFKELFESLGLQSDSAKKNPLNTLLPVYETLWRVVTHCIIEVVFRPSARPDWLPLLGDFLQDLTRTSFMKRSPGTDGVSVEFLVKEALRLYPPTRRIYRQMHMPSKDEGEVVAADIEACQRLQSIWGDESHRYQPARWNTVTATMEKAYMPFGGSPYKCPASTNFGPRMIGILVAAFVSKLRVSGWQLVFQDESGIRSGVLDDEMKLETDRAEGPSWIIQRTDGGILDDGKLVG
ncbi:MAG: hypothetical protein Q9212_004196 [Teloschistes hypoglaucus]